MREIRDHLEKTQVIEDLPQSSGPGLPWVFTGCPTNKELKARFGCVLLDVAAFRIWVLGNYTGDIDGVVAPFACLNDIIREFVKNDAHPMAKIIEGRVRLIHQVSSCDQIVDRFFAARQNAREIDVFPLTPSCPGLGLSSDDQTQRFSKSLPRESPIETDVSGWDWTVQLWELMAEAEMRIQLMIGCDDHMKNLIRNRFRLLANKMCGFSDGAIRPLLGGVMPSGCYVTSSSNSRIRAMIAYMCGAWHVRAMGDDCLEWHGESADLGRIERFYKSLGHRVKQVQQKSIHDFEFCSHRFLDDLIYPSNPGKSMYQYLQGSHTHTRYSDFVWFVRNHPDGKRMVDALTTVGADMGVGVPHDGEN